MKPLIDYAKDLAFVVTGLTVLEKLRKVIRLWKVSDRANRGLTIKNGEYTDLLDALSRIEGRLDGLGTRLHTVDGRLTKRMSNIEERLSNLQSS